MSKFLFCWEQGANLGHIDRMLAVAEVLRGKGHVPVFALRDISRTYKRITSLGYQVFQAPAWMPRTVNPPKTVNFAGILITAGWLDPEGLAALVTAWRELFKLVGADVMLADHSPTALLAWRTSGKPVATLGNSFEYPPAGECFPAFRWWDVRDDAAEQRSDATVLQTANLALGMLGDPSLAYLPEIFKADEHFLLTLPEFAHYAGYPQQTRFWGPSFRGNAGTAPNWPSADGPRVFAYLDPAHKDFSLLITALKKLEWPAIVYAQGISADSVKSFQSHALAFSTGPLNMHRIGETANLIVSHASLGTVTAAALAGTPQLVLPSHMEQYMVARRVEEAGVGLFSLPGERQLEYGSALRRLTSEASFKEAAQRVARRYKDVSPESVAARVADRCEVLAQ